MIASRWVGDCHVVDVVASLEGPLPGCEVVAGPAAVTSDITDAICGGRRLDWILHSLQYKALARPVASAVARVAWYQRAVCPADFWSANYYASGDVAIFINQCPPGMLTWAQAATGDTARIGVWHGWAAAGP